MQYLAGSQADVASIRRNEAVPGLMLVWWFEGVPQLQWGIVTDFRTEGLLAPVAIPAALCRDAQGLGDQNLLGLVSGQPPDLLPPGEEDPALP